jgi:hypothetical protein
VKVHDPGTAAEKFRIQVLVKMNDVEPTAMYEREQWQMRPRDFAER